MFESCTSPVRRNSSVKMMPGRKKATHGQLNTVDRLSDLPDPIVHHIVSFLGMDEACRTSILSKRWTHIGSTSLILDFHPRFFVKEEDVDSDDEFVRKKGQYGTETVDKLVNFIETTMRRYSEENLSIRKLQLTYPTIDQEMVGRIDGWLGIAVQNQLEELSLSIVPEGQPSYELPTSLFFAKSLTSMKFCRVKVPHFQPVKFTSLQSLDLSEVNIDEHMLQEIILYYPLKNLWLKKCSSLKTIVIPHYSRLELLDVDETISKDGTIVLDTSSLQRFTYDGYLEGDVWPVTLKPASKKNLRELRIFSVNILDNTVDKLVSELSSIKEVKFFSCIMPKNINIASHTLEKLVIHDCCGLINISIDAPELDMLWYNGGLELSSLISSQRKRNASINLTLGYLGTLQFLGIKKLLSSKCCKFLSIILEGVQKIEFDEDLLSKTHRDGPYHVRKLNLSVSCSNCHELSCGALIDGLFWSCRPKILSLSITLDIGNTIIRTLLGILEKKVKCWKHPLKRIQVEGTNCSSIFLTSRLDLRLRLYW